MSASPDRNPRGQRRRLRLQPWLEGLEDRRLLSTFKVNTTLDTVAVDLKKGKDASGHVSLRSAIEAANTKGGNNKIILPGGTFLLTITGTGEDNAATGDLDINGKLTIQGKGASQTIIDGNNLDRVFQVLGGKVSISRLTVQHGRSDDGAGLLNTGGQVSLSSVAIVNNLAIGANGGNGAAGVGGGAVGRTAAMAAPERPLRGAGSPTRRGP